MALYTLDIFIQYKKTDKKTDNFEPWVSKMSQGELLTKLNPRYVFKSLPWLGIEFYVSKISVPF